MGGTLAKATPMCCMYGLGMGSHSIASVHRGFYILEEPPTAAPFIIEKYNISARPLCIVLYILSTKDCETFYQISNKISVGML